MSYFKIFSRTSFEEIRSMPGGRYDLSKFEAKILPDRNLVLDMLVDYEDSWEVIGEAEYESVRLKAIS